MRNSVWLLLFLLPIRGYAVLGETADTHIKSMTVATTRSSVPIRYLDHQEDVVSVREYAGPDNKIFAVKWRGQGRPNLPVLLGKYHSEYLIAIAAPRTRIPRRSLSAVSENLSIIHYGTMTSLHGYVVLKNQVPPNVKLDELP